MSETVFGYWKNVLIYKTTIIVPDHELYYCNEIDKITFTIICERVTKNNTDYFYKFVC